MKYKLNAEITVSCYCEVNAASEKEAIAKAAELYPALHFNGSGTNPEENWLIEDADGEPVNIRVDAYEPNEDD